MQHLCSTFILFKKIGFHLSGSNTRRKNIATDEINKLKNDFSILSNKLDKVFLSLWNFLSKQTLFNVSQSKMHLRKDLKVQFKICAVYLLANSKSCAYWRKMSWLTVLPNVNKNNNFNTLHMHGFKGNTYEVWNLLPLNMYFPLISADRTRFFSEGTNTKEWSLTCLVSFLPFKPFATTLNFSRNC